MDENEDLDDEWKPTRIKIPKVGRGIHMLQINRTGNIVSKSGWCTVSLKKQTFEGFTIPHGTLYSYRCMDVKETSGMIMVSDEDLNNLLKTLYLDSLRTVKKK